jgi:hypothetical protein
MLAEHTGSSDRKNEMHMIVFLSYTLKQIHNLTLKQSTNYGNFYPREHSNQGDDCFDVKSRGKQCVIVYWGS